MGPIFGGRPYPVKPTQCNMPALVILVVSFITLRGAFPLDAYIIMNRLVPSDVQCTHSFLYLLLFGFVCGVLYAALVWRLVRCWLSFFSHAACVANLCMSCSTLHLPMP